jgi:DNA anti-recombination protein RmuC
MSSDDTRNLNDHELLLQLMAMFREFDTRLREHDARLGHLEEVIEARLYDTRPIWEAVQQEITELRSDVQQQATELRSDVQQQITELRSDVQQQITELRSDVQQQITELRAEVEKGFRMVNRKVGLFGEQVAELYAYQRDIEERVEKLEPKA